MEKKLSVLGIDIAKQVFHLVGMNEQGTILLRKRLRSIYSSLLDLLYLSV